MKFNYIKLPIPKFKTPKKQTRKKGAKRVTKK